MKKSWLGLSPGPGPRSVAYRLGFDPGRDQLPPTKPETSFLDILLISRYPTHFLISIK